MDIEKLVKEFPNDMELGNAVRNIYLRREKILEEHKDIKILPRDAIQTYLKHTKILKTKDQLV